MADLEALNVMVVDDSPIIIRKLTALLNTLGYVVVKTAENGVEAVETYEQFDILPALKGTGIPYC